MARSSRALLPPPLSILFRVSLGSRTTVSSHPPCTRGPFVGKGSRNGPSKQWDKLLGGGTLNLVLSYQYPGERIFLNANHFWRSDTFALNLEIYYYYEYIRWEKFSLMIFFFFCMKFLKFRSFFSRHDLVQHKCTMYISRLFILFWKWESLKYLPQNCTLCNTLLETWKWNIATSVESIKFHIFKLVSLHVNKLIPLSST